MVGFCIAQAVQADFFSGENIRIAPVFVSCCYVRLFGLERTAYQSARIGNKAGQITLMRQNHFAGRGFQPVGPVEVGNGMPALKRHHGYGDVIILPKSVFLRHRMSLISIEMRAG